MSKSTLTWYKSISRKLMRGLKSVKQVEIARELGETPQVICYRMKNCYPNMFDDVVRLIDMAGYEIREKENEE